MTSTDQSPSSKRQRTNDTNSEKLLTFDASDMDLSDIEFMRKILEKHHSIDELCEYIFKLRQYHIQSKLSESSPVIIEPPKQFSQLNRDDKLKILTKR